MVYLVFVQECEDAIPKNADVNRLDVIMEILFKYMQQICHNSKGGYFICTHQCILNTTPFSKSYNVQLHYQKCQNLFIQTFHLLHLNDKHLSMYQIYSQWLLVDM
jgi:hypothetical protein